MSFIWFALAFPVLLLFQRWIHQHLRGLALLITNKQNWAIILYALILFPGVLLHELSHWFTALLLGVRTGAISLIPKPGRDGSIQLGYVEYYRGSNLGPIRESFIGGAPLIAGTTAILLIAFHIFGFGNLATAIESGDIDQFTLALGQLFTTPDFLLWLYLIFAVSNAMMPSASDRKAWPAFLVVVGALLLVLFMVDGELVVRGLSRPVSTLFGFLATAFSLAIGVDFVFMIVIALVEQFISRIRGVELVYSQVELPPSKK